MPSAQHAGLLKIKISQLRGSETISDHDPVKKKSAAKSLLHVTWDPNFVMASPKKRPGSAGGLTSLMVACQQGLDAEVRNFIARKPDMVAQRDRSGKSALHYCAENTHTACAEQVLDSQPDLLDAQDDEGYSPLHLAVISGNGTMVKFLIDQKAGVDCLDNEKHSCIHWATVCGELECLDLLTEAGANVSTPDIHGAYPLHYAAQMCGPNSEMGNNVKIGFQVLQKLLSKGVDVNCRDQDGRQPLLWAASAETRASKTYCPSGSSDAILTLVKSGSDVSSHDKDGLTALHCAASRGHLDCLETLITLCGSDVDVLDNNGCSPLFYSVTLGHADCTQLLLGFNSKPNLQDKRGRTAAHCGASKGQFETLRILCQHRANLWLRNVRGDTPLHEAVQSGRKELVEWLLEQMEGSVNVTNVNGRTPLHIAAITNNVEMCKILMDHGAYINPIMKNSKGHLLTPLDAALHRGNRGCAKYLQLHGALAASKLVTENEIYRPPTIVPQVTVSPATKRRVFKELGVQTERGQKDVDVQVHLQPIETNAEALDRVDGALQNIELQRQSALKPSRKPLIAKVYVHTKHKDRRYVKHVHNSQHRRGCPENRQDGRTYRRTLIPRYSNERTYTRSKISNVRSHGQNQPVPVVDATTNTIAQAVSSESLPAASRSSYKDGSTSPNRNQLCTCCTDPYQDQASITVPCACHCHRRHGSIPKTDTETQINNADDHVHVQYDTIPEQYTTQPEKYDTVHEKYDTVPERYDTTPEQYNPSPIRYDTSPKEIITINQSEDQVTTDVQEEISDTEARHHIEDEASSVAETQEAMPDRQSKDLLQVEDDLSPLSSLRSIESNVKDSGFSDDVDRGEVSSETEDPRTSPRYHFRRKPIARFVVTSGAADSVYPLHEEDDGEECSERITPRSASTPALKTRDGNRRGSVTYPSRLLGRLALTKEVQKTLRRYQLERRLFYELQELKRQQICGGVHEGEEATVKKMVERFRKHVLCPGLTDFSGPPTFIAFEKYLYEQLRKLSMMCKIPTPKESPRFSTRSYAATKNNSAKQGICVCQTHMCHHIRRPRDSGSLYRSNDQESVRQIILPQIATNTRKSKHISNSRSKSWDRLSNSKRPIVRINESPNFDLSKSLPALSTRVPSLPKQIPPSLLAAVAQRLEPDDVHSDDTVIVELSSDDVKSKVRHAFTVREIREAVRQWEETVGRTLKPLRLEKVLDQEEEGPVTFEIRHGKDRNVFRLPTEKLKGDKKWQVVFTITKGPSKIPVITK